MTPAQRRRIRGNLPFTLADVLALLALVAFGAVMFCGLPLVQGALP